MTVAGLLAAGASASDLTVFAAASLRDLLIEVSKDWADATGYEATISVAGSPLIARQISLGAPADVVILASSDWMDQLAAEGRLKLGSRFDWLGNDLVLIAADADASAEPIDGRLDLNARLGQGRFAMANTHSVPAGIYGRAALEHFGLWSHVSDRLAEAENVRAALAWVATGIAPLGVVYGTDARADPRVAVIGTFPPESHAPIAYPAAAVAHGNSALADRFLQFLRRPEVARTARDHGFLPVGG